MKRQSATPMFAAPGIGAIGFLRRPSRPLTVLTQVELRQFASSIKADALTLQRYAGMRQLRLWEAIALHHLLDPRSLFLNKRGRLAELKQVMYGIEDLVVRARLVNFVYALESTVKDVHAGKISCIKATGELWLSFITLEQYESYVRHWEPIGGLEKAMLNDAEEKDEPELPKFIVDLLAATKLWQDFNPAVHSTQPDVVRHFKEMGYSNHMSSAMATLCRPDYAPKGRPPKNL